jgi:hypothetical protein
MNGISTPDGIEAEFPDYDGLESDRASELDRLFFERNPKRSYRLRPARAGEVPGLTIPPQGWAYVAVRQIQPGVRVRIPVHLPDFPNDREDLAKAIVDAATAGMGFD